MKTGRGKITCAAFVMVLLLLGTVRITAQQTGAAPNQTAPAQEQQNVTPKEAGAPTAGRMTEPEPASQSEGAPVYVPSLSGPGFIQVGIEERPSQSTVTEDELRVPQEASRYFLYGATATIGNDYQDRPSGGIAVSNDSAALAVTSYVALMGAFRRGGYAIQYSPTVGVRPLFRGSRAVEPFHNASLVVNGAFSRRIGWNFSLASGYGSQSVRWLSPAGTSVTSDVVGDNTTSLLVDLRSKEVTSTASAGLGWQMSRKQRLTVTARGSYFDTFFDESSAPGGFHTTSGGLDINFTHLVSARVSVGGYANVDHIFSKPGCSTYGGGLELAVPVTRGISLSLGGGPQGASQGCGNPQFNFRVRLDSPVRSNPRISLTANRQLAKALGQTDRWEDTVGVGISKLFRRTSLGGDAGYAHTESSSGLPGSNGYYFSAYCGRELSQALSVTLTFRQAQFFATGLGKTNFIMLAFGWHPKSVPLVVR